MSSRTTSGITAITFAISGLFGAFAQAPASADPIADFYKNKRVRIVQGSAPGGGYDMYARTLARHLPKRGGRRIFIDYKGKNVKAKVSGSRTKVTINGKKAKRKAIKVGMTCTFTYPSAGSEAKKVDCKG